MKTAKSADPTITHDRTPDRTTRPQCGRPMTADYPNHGTVHTLADVTPPEPDHPPLPPSCAKT